MTETEFTQEECSLMTPEQISLLAQTLHAFINMHGLRVGLTAVIMDRDGIKTVGSMPLSAQAEAFAILHEHMKEGGEGPDAMRELHLKGTNDSTH